VTAPDYLGSPGGTLVVADVMARIPSTSAQSGNDSTVRGDDSESGSPGCAVPPAALGPDRQPAEQGRGPRNLASFTAHLPEERL
jgi:hypothetical protein